MVETQEMSILNGGTVLTDVELDSFEETEDLGAIFEAVSEDKRLEHIPVIELVDPQKEYPVGITADITINVRCLEGCDLGGGTILIGDENDRVIAEQMLTDFADGLGLNTTGSLSVQIPTEAGEYTWTIIFYPAGSSPEDTADDATTLASPEATEANLLSATVDGDALRDVAIATETAIASNDEGTDATIPANHAIVEAEYHFKTLAHITGMTVTRDYQPVVVGADYVINVGLECLSGCSLLGQKVDVFCGGELLTTAEMGEKDSGPLTGLYQAAITLKAPDEVKVIELICTVNPEGLGLSHTSNVCRHYVSTKLLPQCRVDIAVVDSDSLKPPKHVVEYTTRPKGGYPAWGSSDNNGKISLDLAWGEHSVDVTAQDYDAASEVFTIPEGQEEYALTIQVDYHEPLFL